MKKKQKTNSKPKTVAESELTTQACDSSALEAEAGGLRVGGQTGLHNETLS
jgi:hypothetical protein